jgi:hypothetical protein
MCREMCQRIGRPQGECRKTYVMRHSREQITRTGEIDARWMQRREAATAYAYGSASPILAHLPIVLTILDCLLPTLSQRCTRRAKPSRDSLSEMRFSDSFRAPLARVDIRQAL